MSILGPFFDILRGMKRATTLAGVFFGYPTLVTGVVGDIEAKQAMTVAAVYAAVHAYADTISTVDLGTSDATTDEFTPVKTHPMWTLLNAEMNDEETSQQAMAYLVSSLFLRGNAYAQIIWSNLGRVMEIIPLDPTKVTPKRVNKRLVYEVEGEDTPLQPSDVIHVHLNYDRVKLQGFSPVAYARATIGLGMALDNFGLSFFSNGAQTRTLLEHPGKPTKDQAQQLINDFNQGNAGPENAHKTGLVSGGMKVHTLTMPMDDSQFLETRKFGVNEVARWFNLPASRIGGDRSSGTYANLEQDQKAFLAHSVRPVCRMFEQEFNRKLLTPQERQSVTVKFDLDDLMEMSEAPATPAELASATQETANAE